VLIPKKSPATTPNSYRPISLLSIVSKVLEHHVHTLVMEHLHDQHPLSKSQWGFQPGKSTVSALLSTTFSWLRTLEEGKEIGAVFFDRDADNIGFTLGSHVYTDRDSVLTEEPGEAACMARDLESHDIT